MVIVSSGAVGVGAQRLGLAQRPKEIAQKQALAAVGQVHLMRFYEDFFHALGLVRSQPIPYLRYMQSLGQRFVLLRCYPSVGASTAVVA